MHAAEAMALRAAYDGASTILEYGSGGSTVLAGEMPGKTVFSVESDRDWHDMMQRWFVKAPPEATVHLHHADVGPTESWGMPKNARAIRRWPDYALGVWDRVDFLHPDVVLIDGRFRVACLLTTAYRITRPVIALFDDYAPRPGYHRVEELLKPVATIGRMARFELAPQPFPVDRMSWILKFYTRPA
ncbi:MAG: hypothetical protein U1D06_01390 [Paracoccaceae bacterium]|nr:hypothetical protein [Paracoccaceae bacterium]